MRLKVSVIALAACAVGAVVGANAQMGMGPRIPTMRGVWNPVVGSGAVYQVDPKGGNKMDMEISIVGTETVEGKPGYWLETGFEDPRGEGKMYSKVLIVLEGKETRHVRMIVQPPGQPPMEMPMQMMQRGTQQPPQAADMRDQAEDVGSESVTTPAGTFTCEHYRMKDGSSDVWITPTVGPWGVVKSTGKDTNMTLKKVVTNAKSHITGTPVKFDPMEMMRRQMDRQP
jgi:hypothetical protein